jgi:hypothetical protein
VTNNGLYVQFGSGLSGPDGWINFDASPTLRVKRLPVVGSAICRMTGINTPFPETTRFGNVVTGLPLAPNSVSGMYGSHVLEHLPLEDCRVAIRHVYDVLKPGGRFRLIVPDMRARAERYVAAAQSNDPDAVHQLIDSAHVGHRTGPKGAFGKFRSIFGTAIHLWMWDHAAMAKELADAGFVGIRAAKPGDSEDKAFLSVEDPERFADGPIVELAMEAVKPLG